MTQDEVDTKVRLIKKLTAELNITVQELPGAYEVEMQIADITSLLSSARKDQVDVSIKRVL